MRLWTIVALGCAFVAGAFARADAAPPTSLDISAKRVAFYGDRFVVTADGNVRVRLSDGTILRGETFAMDLKLNRYVLAGDVRVDGAQIHAAGAGFAGYPDLDRSYFLPATGDPDRWTFYGLDFANPHPGREQPGDAFYLPDLTGQPKPYIVAEGARIIPKTSVIFDRAGINVFGAYVPTPRFVVTFSSNSHFYENAFAGARADIGVPFNGSEHSLTALHARNDSVNGTYLALDQHFVWDKDWLVVAVNPLTQENRQYNTIGYKRFSPGLESRLFVQLSETQPGIINRPIAAAAVTSLQVNGRARRSGYSFTMNNFFWDLLALEPNAYQRQREHPMDARLEWNGFENSLTRKLPIAFRLRSGIGLAHDQFGEVSYLNDPPVPDLWYYYAGGTLHAPTIRLPKDLTLTAQYDRQRMQYSLPHHVETSALGVSLGRSVEHLSSYLSYTVNTYGDYWGANQLRVYPTAANTITTPFGTYSGQAAFRGFGVTRQLAAGTVFTPTQYFALNLIVQRNFDTPSPVPGAYGQPPWQFTGDARIRLARQILLDLKRSYYFNFANLRWTPQFEIQFSP